MISVCIATYNGEAYIREQLRSILCQIGPEDEVVVADDASTDATIAAIQSIQDKRVRVIALSQHLSVNNTFYTALNTSRGDILFLSDQDDVWLPGKVERCTRALKEVDLVITDALVADSQLQTISPSLFQTVGSRSGLWKNWWKCTYYGSGMAFRRSIWLQAQPAPEHPLIAHDWWIGEIAEIVGKVLFLPEPWYIYRRHQNNVTPLGKSNRSLRTKIISRLKMLIALTHYQINRIR